MPLERREENRDRSVRGDLARSDLDEIEVRGRSAVREVGQHLRPGPSIDEEETHVVGLQTEIRQHSQKNDPEDESRGAEARGEVDLHDRRLSQDERTGMSRGVAPGARPVALLRLASLRSAFRIPHSAVTLATRLHGR